MTNNLETVRAIYADFGKQNIPAIIEHIAEECDWDYASTTDHEVPWLRRRRGPDGVLAFFQSLGVLDFQRFEVKTIVGDGPLVIALCDVTAVVQSTGKRFVEVDEVHLWHFDARGKVARFRHAANTLEQAKALQK